MPKSRGSNSVGSTAFSAGGSGGFNSDGALAGSPEELSNRISNRLSDAGPILVTMDSQTRGREEQCTVTFDPNGTTAQVESASGRTYQVNHGEGSCNCMDHRMRGATCRHIRATEAARGQILSRQTPPTAGAAQTNTQSSVTTQTQLDHQAEEQRQQMTQGISDDGHFYSDPENEQAFNEALSRARNEPLNYDYENALNGSKNTFGLEIEFAGGNVNAIARELYDLGICSSPVQVSYHSSSAPGKWKLERDRSVSGGGELVSPILTDTPETWRTLEKVCEVAKRHGATIDTRCGGHVHIGMDPLDTARQRWKRFFRTVGGYEPELYRLAGGTEGRVRPGTSTYSRPFSRLASRGINSRRTMDSVDDVRSLARELQPSHGDRYHGINLTNLHEYGRPNTVEFRYFNSSLDHRQLQANVKIANGIMMAAEKARIRESGTTEFMKKRGKLIKDTQITDQIRRDDNTGIRKFIDICFTRKKDKDEVLKVFAKNNWA